MKKQIKPALPAGWKLSLNKKTIAHNNKMSEGHHQIEWDRRDETGNRMPIGVYELKVEPGNYSEAKKMLVDK
jgi:flagellar hook assembly protein FlgD